MPLTPLSVPTSTALGPKSSATNRLLSALYSGSIAIGFATKDPPVDHDPGAGWYLGRGRFGRGSTILMLVIFKSLFSSWKGSGGGEGSGDATPSPVGTEAAAAPMVSSVPASRKFLRFIFATPLQCGRRIKSERTAL